MILIITTVNRTSTPVLDPRASHDPFILAADYNLMYHYLLHTYEVLRMYDTIVRMPPYSSTQNLNLVVYNGRLAVYIHSAVNAYGMAQQWHGVFCVVGARPRSHMVYRYSSTWYELNMYEVLRVINSTWIYIIPGIPQMIPYRNPPCFLLSCLGVFFVVLCRVLVPLPQCPLGGTADIALLLRVEYCEKEFWLHIIVFCFFVYDTCRMNVKYVPHQPTFVYLLLEYLFFNMTCDTAWYNITR